ncbi:hypothetical protein AGLY_005403 [Aphis glycines]|uniref:Uncharacterized protein n=1 Tax=Aphis glycines TaxID=307491 RepID=A0A6G0TU16_APHGL|nr:hypothetical protein AGLY_005403 [Aphis glycines]
MRLQPLWWRTVVVSRERVSLAILDSPSTRLKSNNFARCARALYTHARTHTQINTRTHIHAQILRFTASEYRILHVRACVCVRARVRVCAYGFFFSAHARGLNIIIIIIIIIIYIYRHIVPFRRPSSRVVYLKGKIRKKISVCRRRRVVTHTAPGVAAAADPVRRSAPETGDPTVLKISRQR